MKLLFSADLHAPADEGPYRRLAIFAAERDCEVVAIAGDLLDLFGRGYPSAQAAATTGWLKALAAKVPHVVVCSGNHDPDGPNGAGWLGRAAAAAKAGGLLVDGASAVLVGGAGDLGAVVSCCPHWNIYEHGLTHHVWLREQAEKVWREGRRLADAHGLPWVMLHHDPPEGSRVAAGAVETAGGLGGGGFWPTEWCRQYRPDFLLCGHIHHAPFVDGGAWADRVAGAATWAFNPGRDDRTRQSRLVELDVTARTARWLSWDGELEDTRALDGADAPPSAHGPRHRPQP